MQDAIDFVILWVDGSDESWLKEKNVYSPKKVDYSTAINRFRDWGNLQYFFRGVEKFAPWVNNIYFITWGHLPEWLNTNHPKLKVINHKDYIPSDYLPTFNSNTIELNLHRIPELSQKFVLFNDDTFLLRPTKPEDFFDGEFPRDEFSLDVIRPQGEKFRIAHTNVNNTGIINEYFSKKDVIKKHRGKYYNLKYGKYNIPTVLLSPWSFFVGFRNHHLPLSHIKKTFEVLWELKFDALDATCRNRFRGYNDLNHWLMRYWNLCTGCFTPRSSSFGKYFNLSQNNESVTRYIREQRGTLICINDMSTDFDFNKAKDDINAAFNDILPAPSTFER